MFGIPNDPMIWSAASDMWVECNPAKAIHIHPRVRYLNPGHWGDHTISSDDSDTLLSLQTHAHGPLILDPWLGHVACIRAP